MDDLSTEEVEAISNVMGDIPSEKTNEETAQENPEIENNEQTQEQETPIQTQQYVPRGPTISRAQFIQLEETNDSDPLPPHELEWLKNAQVHVQAELGSTKMPLKEILKLQPESIVKLKKMAGEPIEICANDKVIARGEIIIIEDQMGVKILEITGTKQRLETLH